MGVHHDYNVTPERLQAIFGPVRFGSVRQSLPAKFELKFCENLTPKTWYRQANHTSDSLDCGEEARHNRDGLHPVGRSTGPFAEGFGQWPGGAT